MESHCRSVRVDLQQGLGGKVHHDERGKSLGLFQARRMRRGGWRCYTDLHGGVLQKGGGSNVGQMQGRTYLIT